MFCFAMGIGLLEIETQVCVCGSVIGDDAQFSEHRCCDYVRECGREIQRINYGLVELGYADAAAITGSAKFGLMLARGFGYAGNVQKSVICGRIEERA